MIIHEIRCDRCGVTEPLRVSAADPYPRGWGSIDTGEQSLDLCPACDHVVKDFVRDAIRAAVKSVRGKG